MSWVDPSAAQGPDQSAPADTVVGARGAVDLSAVSGTVADPPVQAGPSPNPLPGAAGPGAAGPRTYVHAPLTTDLSESSFDEAMALSQTVPVVLVLYSPSSITSKQAVKVVEDAARASGGTFQVARLDVDAHPTMAQAFQPQAIPSGYALVARRPVPLFEGVPTETQIAQTLDELLQVAPQLGVVGRLQLEDSDLEVPLPPEHVDARAAEENGDWQAAINAWKKVLANNPADSEAKVALGRAEFESRLTHSPSEDPQGRADALFARGQEEAAFAILLDAFQAEMDLDVRDGYRTRLVELFKIGSDPRAVKKARQQLATILMV